MADTSQATHLAQLDLDISQIPAQLQKTEEEIKASAEKIRATWSKAISGTSKSSASSEAAKEAKEQVKVTKAALDSLQLAYSNFQKKLASTKLTPTALKDIPTQANEAREAVERLQTKLASGAKLTEAESKEYAGLVSTLKRLKTELADTETVARQTGTGFNTMTLAVTQTDNRLKSFLTRLGQKGWELASYQAIMVLQRAFYNFIGTIKETEDAVIALQRVIGDEGISTGEINSELYEIAADYGQTFDNVNEAILRFAQAGYSWQESIDATKATMLGLNTAELEITTATNGLIAVMTQFGVEASQLESVIDKINITADNFPVTSEKIVAALQRVGSTAQNNNVSLEETIALITGLSEATGRSGENIGTALNSLMIYMTKSSSLKVFETVSDEMAEIVRRYRMGAASVLDIWQQLSYDIENLTEEQQNILLQGLDEAGYEDFAQTLEAEATDITTTIKSVYQTAGTFRQNYLIALLSDWDTINEALENMEDYAGYSQKQNEDYLDSLTAKVNQLKAAAKELAVAFGESGFLDFLKGMATFTTGLLKLTQQLGGLNTVASITLTIWAALNKELIATKWTSIVTGFRNITAAMKGMYALSGGLVGTLQGIGSSIIAAFAGNPLMAIGVATTAYSILTSAIQKHNAELEEARRLAISEGEEVSNTTAEILSKKKAYDAAKQAYDDVAQASGDLKAADEKLKRASEELLLALGIESDAITTLQGNYEDLDATITTLTDDAKKAAEVKLRDSLQAQAENISNMSMDKPTGMEMFGFGSINQSLVGISRMRITDMDTAVEYLNNMRAAIEKVEEELAEKGIEAATYEPYRQVYNYYLQLKEAVDAYNETLSDLADLRAETIELEEEAAGNDSIVPDYAITDAEKLSEVLDALNDKISEFDSAYSQLNDAVDEYNDSGVLSYDTLQELIALGPEYIDTLDITGNSISINKEKMDDLIATNEDYLAQLAAMNVQQEYNNIMTEYSTSDKEANAIATIIQANATSSLEGEVANLAYQLMTGRISSDQFVSSLNDIGNTAGMIGSNISALTSHILNLTNSYSGLLRKAGIATPTTSTSKSSSGSSSSGGSANSAERTQLQAEIKAWQAKKTEVKDFYDQQIDALKKVQEANDRINDQLDYYNDRQTTVTNLEKARARSGVEYREKEMEYQQELIDLESDWNDKVNDWNIDDKIEELEALRDASTAEIEAIISALQEKVSSLSSSTASGVSSGGVTGAQVLQEAVEEATDNIDEDLEGTSNKATEDALSAIEEIEQQYLERAQIAKDAILEVMEECFFQMKDYARVNANDIYTAYKDGWITPMQADIQSIMQSATNVGGALRYAQTYSSVVNNSSTTSNSTTYYNLRNNYAGQYSSKMSSTDFSHSLPM